MTIPNWYGLILLSLAAYRVWRLLAEDTVMDAPRAWFLYGWRKWRGNGTAAYVEKFIGCPWCFGFWIALAWWGAYQAWPHWTLVVAVPFAISAIVGVLGWAVAS